MAKTNYEQDNTIFALDIGTRSVIGLVVSVQDGSIKVLNQAMVEHQSRAMLDGQIHDIPRVASAVEKVKAELEKKLKMKFKKVALAAAGRSLRTIRCRVEQEILDDIEIEPIIINTLELTGVQEAQKLLEQEAGLKDNERFYCVGHSVVAYYLNNYHIANLVGHKGKTIAADVLATFLPASVVNSLYAVLARVNLEPLYLTLEPIAACEVVIPEQLRLLNLALVDVGAGTSDIAITRDGTVKAYGMVPMAGDEITEVLMEALMVDFMSAEKIKRSIQDAETISYKDVLGLEMIVTRDEVVKLILPIVNKLAEEIASNIIELNGGNAPKSVMCVGGGSQVPNLTSKLAEQLNLSPQRVVIRNRSNISNLTVGKKSILNGPEGVTVVGIAAVASKKIEQNFITIIVNGKTFTLFNTRKLNVINALALIEISPRDLLGYNGRDIRFTLNGKQRTVYGELSKSAVITVNNKTANLQTPVIDGDNIKVEKAIDGKDAVAKVADFIELSLHDPKCLLNGKSVGIEHNIKSEDVLEISPSVEETTRLGELETTELTGYNIQVTVNGQSIIMEGKKEYILIDIFNYYSIDATNYTGSFLLTHNGEKAEYTNVLLNGDNIEIKW